MRRCSLGEAIPLGTKHCSRTIDFGGPSMVQEGPKIEKSMESEKGMGQTALRLREKKTEILPQGKA